MGALRAEGPKGPQGPGAQPQFGGAALAFWGAALAFPGAALAFPGAALAPNEYKGGDINNNNNNKSILVAQGGSGKSKSSHDGSDTQGREFRRPSTYMLRENHRPPLK